MNTIPLLRSLLRSGGALALVLAATLAQPQTRVRPSTQPAGPSMAARSAIPSANGLASPSANPAGLTSQFPAGLPSTLPNPAGLPTSSAPGSTGVIGDAIVTGPAAPVIAAAGAVQAPLSSPGLRPGAYTPLQIAQSFLGADANHDGVLTRGEAQRLSIAPYSFEEMDADHDGFVSRSEYEDALR